MGSFSFVGVCRIGLIKRFVRLCNFACPCLFCAQTTQYPAKLDRGIILAPGFCQRDYLPVVHLDYLASRLLARCNNKIIDRGIVGRNRNTAMALDCPVVQKSAAGYGTIAWRYPATRT